MELRIWGESPQHGQSCKAIAQQIPFSLSLHTPSQARPSQPHPTLTKHTPDRSRVPGFTQKEMWES